MAAPAENSPSLKNRTRIRESTLTKQRELCMNQSKVMHLQQHLQELRNRERQAQLHNKQLLQQFERAQVTLKEVLARNAAMKTIRMEYERYLEENAPRWQQQLQEKTRAAQKKRLEDSLKSFLKKEEAQVLMSTTDGPSRGFATEALKCSAPQTCPQENLDSNQDSFSYCPHTQSHAGECPGVLKGPHLPHTPFLFPPHSFLLHHLTSTPGHYHHPWSEQDEAGWNDPGSEAAGFPSGCLDRLSREKPPASRVSQTSGEENETRGSQVSNKEKAGGSCLSSDLDVKPVRLPSDHAGSSDSSTDSSQTCRQKRKKRRRTQPSSSGSERCGSLKSSIKMIPSSFVLHQSSERNFSSEAGGSRGSRRTERSGSDGSPKSERVEEQSRKESQHVADEDEGTSEKMEDETDEGSRSNSVKTQTQEEEATEHQERNSSEQSSIGEKDEEHRKENVKSGDEDERCDVETDKENSSEEDDDGKEEEDEESEKLKHKDTEIRQEESSQDEDEDGSEGSENEEEEAEQSGDSEDIIIVPQEKRSKQMKMIPEEDEAKTQSENESSEEDIENLLAPQEQRKNKDKDVKADRKLKATRHSMSIFQVSEEKWRTAPKNDSDEFDHFYD